MQLFALIVMIAAAAPAAAQTAPPASPVIVTSGEGLVKRAPDRVWVTISAESRAKAAQDAQQMNAAAMTAVNDRLKAAGIGPDAMQTTGYNLQPEFDYANGRQSLRGYVARNQVTVRLDALAKTGEVISAAVASGATTVSNVRFDLKDRDAAEREALKLAVADARQRAEAAASGARVSIDRVIRIEDQRDTGEIVRPMTAGALMRSEATQAAVPIEAGEIEIRSRVTLTVSIR